MSFGVYMPLDPNEMLSSRFTLADFTKTSTGVPNLPAPDSQELKNLKWTARTMDELYDSIGPFELISGFRTSAVQQALAKLGEPVAKGKSFHEAGMAVDIYPTTMSLKEYFGKILASDWVDKLGEISIKEEQNSLHLSMPTEKTQGVVMALNDVGDYVRLTADQIQEYAKPYLEAVVEEVKKPRFAIFIAAAVGLLFLINVGKKKTA